MIKVFISHSSKDLPLVALLVDLLRSALNLASGEIRCTSLDGYGLPAGSKTDEQLRQELLDSPAFIALLSQASLHSTYVLFEIGARWGARKHIIPLLTPDLHVSDLTEPLSLFNALNSSSRPQLLQLVSNLAQHIGTTPDNPAVYDRHLQEILELTAAPLTITMPENGARVPHRPVVEGRVHDPKADICVVIHPIGNRRYWVQPAVNVTRAGRWKVQVFVGSAGDADVDASFEVRAFANPTLRLKEGETLESWPQAQWSSDIVEVRRV